MFGNYHDMVFLVYGIPVFYNTENTRYWYFLITGIPKILQGLRIIIYSDNCLYSCLSI